MWELQLYSPHVNVTRPELLWMQFDSSTHIRIRRLSKHHIQQSDSCHIRTNNRSDTKLCLISNHQCWIMLLQRWKRSWMQEIFKSKNLLHLWKHWNYWVRFSLSLQDRTRSCSRIEHQSFLHLSLDCWRIWICKRWLCHFLPLWFWNSSSSPRWRIYSSSRHIMVIAMNRQTLLVRLSTREY